MIHHSFTAGSFHQSAFAFLITSCGTYCYFSSISQKHYESRAEHYDLEMGGVVEWKSAMELVLNQRVDDTFFSLCSIFLKHTTIMWRIINNSVIFIEIYLKLVKIYVSNGFLVIKRGWQWIIWNISWKIWNTI